jgi:hypothetical protein
MIETIAYAIWELMIQAVFGLPRLIKKLRIARSQRALLGN